MHPTGADRLVVCLSDIEIGAGGVLDDFPDSTWLSELMAAYCRPPFADLAVDLVFNGDTLDLLKTPVDDAFPVAVDVGVALARLERVLAAHPDFPLGCRRFLAHAGAPRRIWFVVGNHDLELVFREVQDRLRAAIDHDGVHFPGFSVDFGDLHVEHGSQLDPVFAVDADRPLIVYDGRPVLAQPWGAQAIVEVALPLHHLFYDLDRVKPRRRALELLPDVQQFVVGRFWNYYTNDWLRGLVAGAPARRVTWAMLREVGSRFRTADPELDAGQGARELLTSGRYRCVVLGHLHGAEWWSYAGRKLLRTGCMRHEFEIDPTGAVIGQIPVTWAEVYLRGETVVRSHLVEADGPRAPDGHWPATVFDVLPRLRPILDGDLGTAALAAARAAEGADEES